MAKFIYILVILIMSYNSCRAMEVFEYDENIEQNLEIELGHRQRRSAHQPNGEHGYYKWDQSIDADEVSRQWASWQSAPESELILKEGHRRAITLGLSNKYPFYGQNITKVTVATGGFIYTGEYVHSWLAATQYIAPLMANFKLNESRIRTIENGTSFTVMWENAVYEEESFSFSMTLHRDGDIVFMYHKLPFSIDKFSNEVHPVNVGLSDAYIVSFNKFHARRKTIFEYARVSIDKNIITEGSIIRLRPLPTCQTLTDCESCTSRNNSQCFWCEAIQHCSYSNGQDRSYPDWMHHCNASVIGTEGTCPSPTESDGDRTEESTTEIIPESTEDFFSEAQTELAPSESFDGMYSIIKDVKNCVDSCFARF